MVEVILNRHPFAHQLMRFIAYILTGGMIAQFFSCVSVYLLINDSQVAGMIAHLLIQYLSNYFLVCAFIALSLANILVRRGIASFKAIRIPALTLILVTAVTSFLLIPRMDYFRNRFTRWYAGSTLIVCRLLCDIKYPDIYFAHRPNHL